MAKSGWMQEHFDKAYNAGNFELVQVKDLGVKGALDEAVKGIQHFSHGMRNRLY
jgi:hypothetical protein